MEDVSVHIINTSADQKKLHFGNYQLFPTKQVFANSDKTKTA